MRRPVVRVLALALLAVFAACANPTAPEGRRTPAPRAETQVDKPPVDSLTQTQGSQI